MDTKYKNINKEELVKKSIEGNKNALQKLLFMSEKYIYFKLSKFFKNKDIVCDIKQEVLLKVSKNIMKLKKIIYYDSWLNKIILNTMKDYLRHETVKNAVIENFSNIFIIKERAKPQDIVLEIEMKSKIQGAIERLKREEKAILYLKDGAKLSYDDISEVLQIKKGTLKSMLFRIRKKLQKMLEEYIKTS